MTWLQVIDDILTLKDELAEARAQIAAKDAALREIEQLGSDGEHSGDRHARCRDIARAALAAPARETE